MTTDPDRPIRRRAITLTQPGEVRYTPGVTKFADFDRLMQERPNPRPCRHPFSVSGWEITTCVELHIGLVIVNGYRCPDCGELVATVSTALKEIIR